MKKIGILIFAAALIIGLVVSNMFSFGPASNKVFNFSMNFGGVKGSGNVVTDKRELTGFKSIDVGGVFQVEVVAQKDFSVEVESDDNLQPLVTTSVDGDTLRIETEQRISPSTPIRIRISAPDIDDLNISGAASVTVKDLKNEALKVETSGASKLAVSGESSEFNVDMSGASKLDAENLKAGNVTVDASGASRINVNVSGELHSDLSGASKVVYSGTPTKIETKKSGGSSVSQKQ